MLSKLSMSEKAVIYSAPTSKTITNTIADAVCSTSNQAHAYTATVKSTFDEIVYAGTATDIDITASRRLVLGVFLANDQDSSQLVHVAGSVRLLATSASLTPFVNFGFGRTNSATITQSDVAAANTIDNAVVLLPSAVFSNSVNNMNGTTYQINHLAINEYMLVDKQTTTSDNPLAFFATITNPNSGGVTLVQFLIHLTIRSMNYAIPINTPGGV